MDLADNLNFVHERIAGACERVDRDPESVKLVAVSKTHSADTVKAAVELGQTVFGESRIQEAKLKISNCPKTLAWHLIGHLQSNKARDAVSFFRMIHSVDSFHLAEEINRQAERQSRSMPILIQVNVSGEASKFGYDPKALFEEFDALNELGRLEIHGFMTMAPWSPEPEKARPHFRRLREVRDECEQILGAPLPELSMGMSGDYEQAIEEGATLVRVGTGLFGARVRAKDQNPAG